MVGHGRADHAAHLGNCRLAMHADVARRSEQTQRLTNIGCRLQPVSDGPLVTSTLVP